MILDVAGESTFVRIGDSRLRVLEFDRASGRDDARTVLAVHSVSSHADSWRPLVARLDTPARIVCPDLRGHGFSDWTRSGYWLSDFAGDLIRLCDLWRLSAIDVVGPSMGGRIAALVARALGPRLSSLALLDSAPVVTSGGGRAVHDVRAGDATRYGFATVDKVRQSWIVNHPDWSTEAIDVRARYLYRRNWAGRLVSRNDPDIAPLFGRAAACEVEDVWAALRSVTAPVLVARGRRSYLMDESIAGDVCGALANARYVELDAGHYLCFERLDQTAATLDRFWTDFG